MLQKAAMGVLYLYELIIIKIPSCNLTHHQHGKLHGTTIEHDAGSGVKLAVVLRNESAPKPIYIRVLGFTKP